MAACAKPMVRTLPRVVGVQNVQKSRIRLYRAEQFDGFTPPSLLNSQVGTYPWSGERVKHGVIRTSTVEWHSGISMGLLSFSLHP